VVCADQKTSIQARFGTPIDRVVMVTSTDGLFLGDYMGSRPPATTW
jgi:hypothetical protein